MQSTDEMKKLGKEIRFLREKILDMSQEEFACRLGMHRRSVQGWEYGTIVPMGGTMIFLKHLSRCPVAQTEFKRIALKPL